jgi:hypothetical protein
VEEDSDLFVARESEGRTFRTFLRSFERGAIFVEGGTGVGKTSFVKVQEYRCGRGSGGAKLLPTLKPIQLASTLEPRVFLLSVLSNVLGSLSRASPKVTKRPAFQRLSLAVGQSVIQTGGWSAEAFGFGGGRDKDVTVAGPLLVLLSNVSDLLDQAAELAAATGYERIVVNVNNLELIGTQALTSFLDVSRDFTLTREKFLWIFIGPIGARAAVAQKTQRVSELIQSDPIWLAPLRLEDIHTAISARVRKYRTASNVQAPIERSVVDMLYRASSGDLRHMLNRSRDLLTQTMVEFPTTREITVDIARPLLRRMTEAAPERVNLTPKQLKILRQIAVDGPCQPRDHTKFGFRSAPAFVRYLLKFYELGLVDRRRRGPDVVYTPRGDVVLALSR